MAVRALSWPFTLWALVFQADAAAAPSPRRKHYWPNVRGNVGSYGVSDVKVPRNFSNGQPSWRWHHPDGLYGTTVVGGPVIDFEKNLYIVEMTGVHKFSPDGKLLWTAKPQLEEKPGCYFPDGPSLMEDSVYVTTQCGELCSIDIATGKYLWGGSCRRYFPSTGMDSKYVTTHEGVVIIGTDDAGAGGSRHVVAVNGTDGSMLWQFKPDVPTWNNMGQFPGDDTVVFQDWDSRAYRLGLRNGTLLWKSGGRSNTRWQQWPYAETWTDGGLLLGADNVAYAVSSSVGQGGSSTAWVGGGVHAHRLSDGQPLWDAPVAHPVLTWPVSAKLDNDTSFTVFAFPGPGAHKNCQPYELMLMANYGPVIVGLHVLLGVVFVPVVLALSWACSGRRMESVCRISCVIMVVFLVLHGNDQSLNRWERWYYAGENPSDIVALDAETGAVKFTHVLARWAQPTAKGDQEGFGQKVLTQRWRPLCCPVAYSSPSVDGNGVVYVGHMSGTIFGVKDWDRDGAISEDEVYTFDAEGAFLHSGPAFAPGMFAFTTCDQLFVWNF